MGFIDKKTATLTCATCGFSEDLNALEKGDAHSSSWQTFGSSEHFFFGETEDRIGGPVVTSATCKKCKNPARVNCRHTFP